MVLKSSIFVTASIFDNLALSECLPKGQKCFESSEYACTFVRMSLSTLLTMYMPF